MQEYWTGMQFLQKVIQMDSLTTKQKPDFRVSGGDLLSIRYADFSCVDIQPRFIKIVIISKVGLFLVIINL